MSFGATTRPSRLGRYELITQIGQGGMAEVQLAIQRGPAGFEKLVVVKLVHENLASQKAFVDMLLEEARMAALVKHPNVVDIYDLGQADGRYFIAMEYLEGEPLLAVLRAGREGKRLDVLSTARLVADTAEGLDAAHELRTLAGDPIELVHHDVSLGNIVVLYNGQVKLVDFGVAKATQTTGQTTRVQGKFSYMAPEKLRGSAGDRRSDIWSLGCVLWESLTLRRLFKGGNDNDTMKQVLETPIVPPSSVNAEVPRDFDPIVMTALSRDPDARYATAKEMAAAIEEVLREHRYGGRNDLIARYMQSTFEAHIAARKKLLQEVSSKGRASADVLEAAFDEMTMAVGSPNPMDTSGSFRVPSTNLPIVTSVPSATTTTNTSGAFSVKFRREEVSGPGERTSSPRLPPPTTPPLTTARSQRPSQNLYVPDSPLAGGGTAKPPTKSRTTRVVAVIGAVVVAVVAIVVIATRGGEGTSAKASPGSGSASRALPAPRAVIDAGAGSATGGSGAATGSAGSAGIAGSAAIAAGSAEPAAGSATGAPASAANAVATDAPSEAPGDTPPGDDAGSASEPEVRTPTRTPTRPVPPKGNAQELFKTGMQAYVKGDVKTSITQFRKAVQANPQFAAAWRALGLAYEKSGEWGQAKTAFQKYISVAPNAQDAAQIRERIKNL